MAINYATFKKLLGDHRPLIPITVDNHLESAPNDSSFAGSVFVDKQLVPTLFLKLSPKTATRIGMLPEGDYHPSYKFLTIEDQDGNMVCFITLQDSDKTIMHAQLNPADQQVREFIRLTKQQQCFILDITVAHKTAPYGSSDFFEVDGEHLDWTTRNLVRAQNAKASNNWSRAARAYKRQQGLFSRDIYIDFHDVLGEQLHAARNTDFISRGDDDYQPDLESAMKLTKDYQLDWLEAQHGIALSEEPAVPINVALLQELDKFHFGSIYPAQLKELERLNKQNPAESTILFLLMAGYAQNGEVTKMEEVQRELAQQALNRTYVALTLLRILPDEEFLVAFSQEWPKPELTHHPRRGGHPFTLEDFLLFEELTIRRAILKNELQEAIQRFARLVQFNANGAFLETLSNHIASKLLLGQVDHKPVVPNKPPLVLLKVKYPPARKLLTDSYSGVLEVLRTKIELRESASSPSPSIIHRKKSRVGRNAPCPCGSGRKYKKCCGS